MLSASKPGRLPLKLWITEQELYQDEKMTAQTLNCVNHPAAFHHVALMPDAHAGYGMPVGGVMALEDAISPHCVGLDIGCGMNAVKTSINAADINDIREQLGMRIIKRVAAGVGGQRHDVGTDVEIPGSVLTVGKNPQSIRSTVNGQVGTLGSGNHFIELDVDEDGFLWIVVHSGSRNVGKQVAEYYHKLTVDMNHRWRTSLPDKDVAFLPTDTGLGEYYVEAMNWALDYAFENRAVMMDDVIAELRKFDPSAQFSSHINVHHNYAAIENHFGRNVWVHRKGATRARLGELLVIPGNMGDGTVIALGLGNQDSFCTSSHGAGRPRSRGDSRRMLDLDEETKYLTDRDIVVVTPGGMRSILDEAPHAYKDFEEVMSRQSDLVSIHARLHPTLVVKG